MPRVIDQEALDSPNLKVLDINNPPTKQVGYERFPKLVYLHPVDKTREHRFKTVADADELAESKKQGWREKPHIPSPRPDLELENGEFETGEEKRGPGRPRSESAA